MDGASRSPSSQPARYSPKSCLEGSVNPPLSEAVSASRIALSAACLVVNPRRFTAWRMPFDRVTVHLKRHR